MTESIFMAHDAGRRARVPKNLPLVLAMSGINDPGAVVSQLDTFFWQNCQPEEVLRFNTDELLDYRARRPMITFEQDHFTDYSPEQLILSLCADELGSPFLLLSGFEPDFRWEKFVDTMLSLVDEFEVSVTVWAHAIPMPVPHTRPLRATVSGTREDLIDAISVWKPTTKLPASVTQLIEYRLHSLGDEVVGFAILVPHYLAGNEYPDVLLFALDHIMSATGMLFSTDEVRDTARQFRAQVDEQIAQNEESGEMLRGLEGRYDSYMEDQTTRSPLISEDGTIPTADQLASELEKYLAQHRDDNSSNDQA